VTAAVVGDPPFDPNEEMKKWPIYRVASMKEDGGIMEIRSVRCSHIMEVHAFLKRLYSISSLADLFFCEIHELLPGGRVALVHEARKDWPKNIKKENNFTGVICPKIPRAPMTQEARIEAVVKELAQTAVTVQPASLPLSEEGRPFRPYKIEVA